MAGKSPAFLIPLILNEGPGTTVLSLSWTSSLREGAPLCQPLLREKSGERRRKKKLRAGPGHLQVREKHVGGSRERNRRATVSFTLPLQKSKEVLLRILCSLSGVWKYTWNIWVTLKPLWAHDLLPLGASSRELSHADEGPTSFTPRSNPSNAFYPPGPC